MASSSSVSSPSGYYSEGLGNAYGRASPLDVSDFLVGEEEIYDERPLADTLLRCGSLLHPALASGKGRAQKGSAAVVAFRTKSDKDVLDDGYKWRKYGKKPVKNSPNLRNYYRCSAKGCTVKKRVERDRTDGSYVITSYQGKHIHLAPSPSPTLQRTATMPTASAVWIMP